MMLKSFIHHWAWLALVLFVGLGIFFPVVGVAALFCMLAPVGLAFFRGREWCGNYCPRGSFNDMILEKVSRKGSMPQWMKHMVFRWIFAGLLLGAFAVQLVFAWGSWSMVGLVFVRMILLTTLLTILLGVFFNHRAWCMICPMGTMAHYASKSKNAFEYMKKVHFNKNACINCRICAKNCPMGIDVLNYKEVGQVNHGDCLKCNVCVEKCPKEALQME